MNYIYKTYEEEVEAFNAFFDKVVKEKKRFKFELNSENIKIATNSNPYYTFAISDSNCHLAISLKPGKKSRILHENTVLLFVKKETFWKAIGLINSPFDCFIEKPEFGKALALNSDGTILFISDPSVLGGKGCIYVYENQFLLGSVKDPVNKITGKQIVDNLNSYFLEADNLQNPNYSLSKFGNLLTINKSGSKMVASCNIEGVERIVYCELNNLWKPIFINYKLYCKIFEISFISDEEYLAISCHSALSDNLIILIYKQERELDSKIWRIKKTILIEKIPDAL
jgi:hypothetical protein